MAVSAAYVQEDLLKEQSKFLNLLYHDARNGQMIRLIRTAAGVDQFSTCDIQELQWTGTDGTYGNVYTSLNTFKGKSRKSDCVFNISGIYIDLDGHGYSEDELDGAIKKTLDVIDCMCRAEELLRPTMITATGRGLGLFYLLQASIANTDASKNSIRLYDTVVDKLTDRYSEILSGDGSGLLEVDTSVRDHSRIVRMPGTPNLNNGKICRLLNVTYDESGTPKYYHLRQLIAGCHLEKNNEKEQNRNNRIERKNKVVNINTYLLPFLGERIKRLETLRGLRGEECTGKCREVMSFIAYSALVQTHVHDEAVELLRVFNAGFSDPLPQEELDHIVAGTDANIIPFGPHAGEKGYYAYSDLAVMRALDITPEEAKRCGFGTSWKRQLKKEETRRKRQERTDAILEAVKTHPELTYAQIAELIGTSKRTVERTVKEHQVGRYNTKAIDEKEECVFEAADDCSTGTAAEFLRSDDSDETAKNIPESLGVGGERGTLFFLFSLLRQQGWSREEATYHRLLGELWSFQNSELSSSVSRYINSVLSETSTIPTLTPDDALRTVMDMTAHFAHWIVDYRRDHGLTEYWYTESASVSSSNAVPIHAVKQNPVRKKTSKAKGHVDEDFRFKVLRTDPEYVNRLDSTVVDLVGRALHDLKYVKMETYRINDNVVRIEDLRHLADRLSYKDLVVIVEHIQQKCPKPTKPLFYVIKVAWCLKNPKDATHLSQKQNADNNGFCNFESRKYSQDFYDQIELAMMYS